MLIQVKDSDGTFVRYPVSAPKPKSGYTIEDADESAIPPGPGTLLRKDGVFVRVPPVLPVPTLTARQLRLWLLSVNITPEEIDAQIAAIADAAAQARARVEWEYASEYKHDHPLVLQIGAALGLDQAQIDAGFRTAAAF